MENKGAIRFFAIVLALVVVYQLSFTFFAYKVEKDAEKFAQGDPVQERRYLDSIAEEEVYNFLWLRSYTYKECSEKTINLGLDLKGGMNVILEISVEDVITSNAAPHYLKDPLFTETMRTAKAKKANSQSDFVDLFAESFILDGEGLIVDANGRQVVFEGDACGMPLAGFGVVLFGC